jgi:succinate dehydrogenase/fumarate reductase flavoprotein subunit
VLIAESEGLVGGSSRLPGGLMRIDRDAQVISEAGRPIPGLFAAGESAGGVVGPRYVGSGNSYANCVTFGRVGGTSAARVAMAPP